MRLYIIGNGFDIAHEIKTSYWDFRCYLEKYAEEFLRELERLYGFYPFDPDEYHIPKNKRKNAIENHNNSLYHKMWSSFEESLGRPEESEFESVCDSAIDGMNYLESGPVGIEDTLRTYFNEQFGFVVKLQDYLLKWVKQIRLKGVTVKKDELINCTDYFLTFNYTPTLERIYNVSTNKICHIHGGYSPYCLEAPVIGHGNKKSIQNWMKWKVENDNVFDEGGSSKCQAIADFYYRTFKDSEQILKNHSEFFDSLNDICEVIVIGHSIGDVDMPYFKKIVERIGESIPWKITYYYDSEMPKIEMQAKTLGLKNVNMIPSSDYWDR